MNKLQDVFGRSLPLLMKREYWEHRGGFLWAPIWMTAAALSVVYILYKVVGLIGARVLPVELPVSKAASLFDADGRLIDDELRVRLSEVVNDLVAAAQEREAVQATG